ncbi:MAG TPA: hypothetical protein DIV86_00990 [Alphaproteobacteria bacterium]|nr:hypothetical protein [Alphaproteobacteria bacterium]
MKKNIVLISILVASVSIAAIAENADGQKTKSITIYGNSPQSWSYNWYSNYNSNVPGFAVITNSIEAELNQGNNEISIDNLPDEIEPSSIQLKKLSDDLQIIEQQISLKRSIQVDLLQNNIGREVEVVANEGSGAQVYKGVLLETNPRLVIKEDENRVRVINNYASISAFNAGAKPQSSSVKWLLFSKEGDPLNAEYNFKTSGINWSAQYGVFINDEKDDNKIKATLEGWANIVNATSFDVENSKLKLVAGNINQEVDQLQRPMMRGVGSAEMAMDSMVAAPKSFSMNQQKLSDYYSFSIERDVSLPANSFKKIKLFDDKKNILLKKKYVFNGMSGSNRVDIVLTLENTMEKGLGLALAGGKYIAYTKDSKGGYETIGEAITEGKKEKDIIDLTIGSAFDVSARRTQTNEKYDNNRRQGSYSVVVELENSKDKEVVVNVAEQMNNQNWKIVDQTKIYEKLTENLISFPMKIPAKSKERLQFTVEYSW